VAVDETVEALAAEARQRLRRALRQVTTSHPTAADATATVTRASIPTAVHPVHEPPSSVRQATVAPLLHEVYDAQPDWAEAFSRWKSMHRRDYATDVDARAEAAAFTAFRDNVLSAARTGRPLHRDELGRFDMSADARRSLAHFA